MNKDQFLRTLARAESYVLSVRDLLQVLQADQFSWTKEGARAMYKEFHGTDEARCALSWMDEHYDSIEATVRAALNLCETAESLTEPLWSEAAKLIPELKEET